MRKKIIYILPVIFLITSCQSLKNLTSKSTSQSSSTSYYDSENNVRFLNDISVTPGNKESSNKYVYSAAKKKKSSVKIIEAPVSTVDKNTEMLQSKYAALLNVPEEELGNLNLLQNIEDWWGTKYCMGGQTNKCIDCSAFTQAIMRDVYRKRISRTAQEQYRLSERIKQKKLSEGDLVFFHTTSGSVSHVGIYLTNNKFVHASSSNGVMISDLNDNYWSARYAGAGRVNLNDVPPPQDAEEITEVRR